jgi:arylsulfatase A-like enzyme
MKFRIKLFFVFLFFGLPLVAQNIQKPNIIIILTDDQGYQDVGFNGSLDIKTPHIDRIAENGVKFTNGYVSYAVCGPSRAGLITGRYQDRFGFGRNPLFAPKDALQGLPLSEQTISEVLKKQGYVNMAVGKWHLGAHRSQRPLKRGFDEFFGFLSGGHKYFPKELIKKNISELTSQFDAYNTKLLRNNQRIEETEYLTDAFSREAVNFVERNKDQPFFLYLAYNAPHTPLQATQKYLDRYPTIKNEKRKSYAAMISAVDDGVGNLMNKLEALKISENTLIFFLSDNGGVRNSAANNGNLKAGKGSLFEGGIRVPFAMQWPSVISKGQVYPKPVISLDIFATVIAQINAPSKNTLDGVNIIPYLNGNRTEAPHKALYWKKIDQGAFAIREGDIKLVKMKETAALYNLSKDISEKNKLLNKNKRVNELMNAFQVWNDSTIPAVFFGLRQNDTYNTQHPNRFKKLEKY